MNGVLELEKKVEELEKRIEFLYETVNKQCEINASVINNLKALQESISKYSRISKLHTLALTEINNISKNEEES